LTFTGVHPRNSKREPTKAHVKENWMTNWRVLSHTVWECKIPRVHLSRNAAARCCMKDFGSIWASVQTFGRAEGMRVLGRPLDARPRAYASFDSAQVCGVGGGGIHQRQEARFIWRGPTASTSRIFAGQHFWARGYFVSTVGRDETAIREYIRNQEVEDKRLDQLKDVEVAT